MVITRPDGPVLVILMDGFKVWEVGEGQIALCGVIGRGQSTQIFRTEL